MDITKLAEACASRIMDRMEMCRGSAILKGDIAREVEMALADYAKQSSKLEANPFIKWHKPMSASELVKMFPNPEPGKIVWADEDLRWDKRFLVDRNTTADITEKPSEPAIEGSKSYYLVVNGESVHIVVEPDPEGQVRASCPALPNITPTYAETSDKAISILKFRIEKICDGMKPSEFAKRHA